MFAYLTGTQGKTTTFTFPVSLSRIPYSIQRTVQFNSSGEIARGDGVGVKAVSATGFTIYSSNISNATGNWVYVLGPKA